MLKLKVMDRSLCLLQVYAPNATSEYQTFVDEVNDALLRAEVKSSRTHFEVLGLEGQVLGLGLEASSPRKLACPRLEDSTIF